jgi:LAO/AO transport system kinase
MLERLLGRFGAHDRLALSRLLTHLSRGEHVAAIRAGMGTPARPALVVAITGSAGVGKSTLIGRLLEAIRAGGQSVAVLACDPQSPLSGGALLGDRFRMPSRPEDDGVYIRSLATAGGNQAVAEHLDDMIRLLEVFGFDVVILETVGAGQGDTAVRHLADVVVLLLQPETGDDLQWEKAGVLEVADVHVIHKGDLPGASEVEAQVRSALSLGDRLAPPVFRVSSRTGEGLPELWATLRAHPRRRQSAEPGAELLRLAQQAVASGFVEQRERLRPIVEGWHRGAIGSAEAITQVFQLLAKG